MNSWKLLIDIGGTYKEINTMDEIKSNGVYTVKETGESVSYDFTYQSFLSMDDAIETLGEATCLKSIQRMTKVDSNNTAREKAKVVNGHSTRQPMTEEEKAKNKAERSQNNALLKALKDNPDLLAQIQESL